MRGRLLLNRVRREPPPFLRVAVRRTAPVGARLLRITLAGDELRSMAVDQPAASVRLLLPSSRDQQLVLPVWNGNEFLLADGRRPVLRTFTPRRLEDDELDIDVVLHGEGAASAWAASATEGDQAAVSGPGRGYVLDDDAPGYLLAGDETAIPAISQLLEAIPPATPVQVLIEVTAPEGRAPLPSHPSASVQWVDALVAAVQATTIATDTRVWAAGEAAAMQRLRRHLFDERAIPRAHATVRGYWKQGRSGVE